MEVISSFSLDIYNMWVLFILHKMINLEMIRVKKKKKDITEGSAWYKKHSFKCHEMYISQSKGGEEFTFGSSSWRRIDDVLQPTTS